MSMISFSRRNFLLGMASVSTLAVTYTTYRQIGEYPDNGLNLSSLENKEVLILQKLGNWLIPPREMEDSNGNIVWIGGGDNTSIQNIDTMFASIPPNTRWLLSALLLAFEHGTVLEGFGNSCMSQLSDIDLAVYLDDWAMSDSIYKQQLFAVLKTIFGFAYFEREDVLASLSLPSYCPIA